MTGRVDVSWIEGRVARVAGRQPEERAVGTKGRMMVEPYGWGSDDESEEEERLRARVAELKPKLAHVEAQRDRYNQELLVVKAKLERLKRAVKRLSKDALNPAMWNRVYAELEDET
jgi:chromosome segregation ATPase